MIEKLMTWGIGKLTCTWCGKTIHKGNTVFFYVTKNDEPFPNTVTHKECWGGIVTDTELRIRALTKQWREAQRYRGWFE